MCSNKVMVLNSDYSTTKLCYKLLDDKYLANEKIKENCKFKLNFPEFEIIDSKILAKEGERFDTYLFLPEGKGRKGEGGLRTKGYFKFSYEKKDNDWYIVENNKLIKKVNLDENVVKDYEKLPLISIITVVFNGEKYLEETIQSVINQTYPNLEYIIIDGGSTDGTLDIIKKYEDYIDYWISEKDNGISDAFNKAMRISKGVFLYFLNNGDLLFNNNVLEEIFKEDINKYDLITGFVKNELFKMPKENIFYSSKLYNKVRLAHQATFINIQMLKRVGFFNIDLNFRMDLDLFYRIFLNSPKIKYVNTIIAYYLLDGTSDINQYKMNKEGLMIDLRYNNLSNMIFILYKYMIIFFIKNPLKKFIRKIKLKG